MSELSISLAVRVRVQDSFGIAAARDEIQIGSAVLVFDRAMIHADARS